MGRKIWTKRGKESEWMAFCNRLWTSYESENNFSIFEQMVCNGGGDE